MSEANRNSFSNNMKYLFVIVGILALVASYFLVFSKYNKKIDSINSEIDVLELRKDDLVSKNDNKDNIVEETKTTNQKFEELVKKFAPNITYQSQLMDNYNMSQNIGIEIPTVGVTAVSEAYTFGQIPTSNPNGGVGGLGAENKGVVMTYNISTIGTYAQMTETINYILNENGKRKVPSSISFAYDSTTQEVALTISAKEYAIIGTKSKLSEISIPAFPKSTQNIFYNEIITQ